MNDDQINRATAILAGIERNLAVLAEYADMLRIQSSGEKVYEVGSYVCGVSSKGDGLVYLYATHPGLQYRVCTVYEERFGELPLRFPAQVKTWDGEVAPSRDGAARKGYLIACQPFKVSLLPTGATTDAGLPVHRFNRVLGEGANQRSSESAQQRISADAPEDEAAAREWEEMTSASAQLPAQPAKPEPEPGPKVSPGAKPLPAQPAASQPTQPRPSNLPATLSGDAGPAFKKWALEFSARRITYRAKDGEPDMYHILMTVAEVCGVRQVTMENIEEVKGKLESHAAQK